jgi:hypothetical protein
MKGYNRILRYGPFPRAGYGQCDVCGRRSQILFYWNRLYLTDPAIARRRESIWACRPCLDRLSRVHAEAPCEH